MECISYVVVEVVLFWIGNFISNVSVVSGWGKGGFEFSKDGDNDLEVYWDVNGVLDGDGSFVVEDGNG